ncbi:hypothetical protein E2C01_075392 [Portunus trituberculatus]|uniref:Uncharacterized protein n=1 Tax=Portunus trituberculatus TaxID=210409 RepID=A0A5B7IG10_PORTR|nr:hypothetical protein [Portunus trituberculatus]
MKTCHGTEGVNRKKTTTPHHQLNRNYQQLTILPPLHFTKQEPQHHSNTLTQNTTRVVPNLEHNTTPSTPLRHHNTIKNRNHHNTPSQNTTNSSNNK